MRQEDTERPFTSALLEEHRKGTFNCAACDLPLYASETKYESGTGWPSFFDVLPNAVGRRKTTRCFQPAPKSIAAAAAGIWAMSSRTAPSPPACAIA